MGGTEGKPRGGTEGKPRGYFEEHFYMEDIQSLTPQLGEKMLDSDSESGSSESGSSSEAFSSVHRPTGVKRWLTLYPDQEFLLRVERVERNDVSENIDIISYTGRQIHCRKFEKYKMSEDPVKYTFSISRMSMMSKHTSCPYRPGGPVDEDPLKWHVYFMDDGRPDSKSKRSALEFSCEPHGMNEHPLTRPERWPSSAGSGNWMDVFYMAAVPSDVFTFTGERTSAFGTEMRFSFWEPISRITGPPDPSDKSRHEKAAGTLLNNHIKARLEERNDIKVVLNEEEGMSKSVLDMDNKAKKLSKHYCNCTFSI